mgnify:CR=1 FL=1
MKKLPMFLTVLCLMTAMALPASALEYDIAAPEGPEYANATSIDPVVTADRGEAPNVDVSKNAALIPPSFGSASAYTPNTGYPLTPNLAPGYMVGEVVAGSDAVTPPSFVTVTSPSGPVIEDITTVLPSTGFTDVTSGLYYSAGYLATLKIPSLDVSVKVYEGTTSKILAKGAGHFSDTSIWDGNVCVAGHNRGVNCYFADIHTLNIGDKITLTTKLGTRTYSATGVYKISELDNSLLAPTAENCLTLFTCVRNQSSYRWAVRAVEI